MDDPSIVAARRMVTEHPLLGRSLSADDARLFMSHHVFAVWDFMTLLKRLQSDVASTQLPWRPPANRELARLVNEIVLAEETDEDGTGGHASHFETYLAAMTEAHADRAPIDRFLRALGSGAAPLEALESSGAPAPAAAFVRHTLGLATDPRTPTAAVAAAFFHGRESIVPAMFRQLLVALESARLSTTRLRWYLTRHIALDEDEHGPMGERVLAALCTSPDLSRAAAEAAIAALTARRALWDGVLGALDRPHLQPAGVRPCHLAREA